MKTLKNTIAKTDKVNLVGLSIIALFIIPCVTILVLDLIANGANLI